MEPGQVYVRAAPAIDLLHDIDGIIEKLADAVPAELLKVGRRFEISRVRRHDGDINEACQFQRALKRFFLSVVNNGSDHTIGFAHFTHAIQRE